MKNGYIVTVSTQMMMMMMYDSCHFLNFMYVCVCLFKIAFVLISKENKLANGEQCALATFHLAYIGCDTINIKNVNSE